MIANDQRKRVVLGMIPSGHENAITGKSMARTLGLKDDRSIRLVILELIRDGHPIAAETDDPAGYFFANTPEEVHKYALCLRSRLIKDALRRRDFLRASRSILQPEQLPLM